jgi:HTH-type transcriptional regulator/antitoxin MqsA
MNAKTEKCPICGNGEVKRKVTTETFEYKGKVFDYPDYIIYECPECGEAVVDKVTLKESGRAIRDFYREVDGLLVSSEIQRIRKFKLCLTQDLASELLGGGAKSFARYENNEVIQSVALDNLLRILDRAPHMIDVIKNKNMGSQNTMVISFSSKYDPNPLKMVANYGK